MIEQTSKFGAKTAPVSKTLSDEFNNFALKFHSVWYMNYEVKNHTEVESVRVAAFANAEQEDILNYLIVFAKTGRIHDVKTETIQQLANSLGKAIENVFNGVKTVYNKCEMESLVAMRDYFLSVYKKRQCEEVVHLSQNTKERLSQYAGCDVEGFEEELTNLKLFTLLQRLEKSTLEQLSNSFELTTMEKSVIIRCLSYAERDEFQEELSTEEEEFFKDEEDSALACAKAKKDLCSIYNVSKNTLCLFTKLLEGCTADNTAKSLVDHIKDDLHEDLSSTFIANGFVVQDRGEESWVFTYSHRDPYSALKLNQACQIFLQGGHKLSENNVRMLNNILDKTALFAISYLDAWY